MKASSRPPLPPRVSMDEYVAFVEESFRAQQPDRVRQQKHLEERIERAFDMTIRPGAEPVQPPSR